MIGTVASHDFVLPIDAFVRSVAVNRGVPHAFFLGAGASVSSGVPSAGMCVWRWKRDVFVTNNPELKHQVTDVSVSGIQMKIQQWLDREQIYPALDSPEEYSFFAETCFPIPEDRRVFFQTLSSNCSPHTGYQLLGLLAEEGIVKSVWTTNFDGLVVKAARATSLSVIEVGLDSPARLERLARDGELVHVALHGDYRYDLLKNTTGELITQDEQLRGQLISHLQSVNLIVSGYSGRDDSIMSALAEAYSAPGRGRLYWCGLDGAGPSLEVEKLLTIARSSGREAYYVPTSGFDDVMVRLSRHCLTSDNQVRANSVIKGHRASKPLAPFRLTQSRPVSVIKSNAFPIECPSEVLQFEVEGLDATGVWKDLRKISHEGNIVAVPQRGVVLALGTIDEVKRSFGSRLRGEVVRSPISESELSSNGAVSSLLTSGLVRGLAQTCGLDCNFENMVWKRQFEEATIQGVAYRVHDAAVVHLRRYGGKQYMVVKPTIKSFTMTGDDAPEEDEKEIKRQLLTRQWNQKFNDALNEWTNLLLKNNPTRIEFPVGVGSTFTFQIGAKSVWTQLASSRPLPSLKPESMDKLSKHLVFSGVQYEEPKLVFSNRQGDGFIRDAHPMLGLFHNRPYDFGLVRHGLSTGVRVGVICPSPDGTKLSHFLNGLLTTRKADSKQEYLLDYPGFSAALGVSLNVPSPGAEAWGTIHEPQNPLSVKQATQELGRRIITAIDAVYATASPNVVLIFIPERWRKWERYNDSGEHFDLHDFVKAYCVQKGVATQFLREATLSKANTCEIIWWLALSMYVKARGTLWVLDDQLQSDVAFMGIGYSLDRVPRKGNHVILGCSHLYNAEGRGLKYTLSKIEDPIIRQGNPFMSKDDARRVGENVREMLYEASGRLPSRLVIHKRTPFREEEREGLLQGLQGIDDVDMLEVTVEPALRYVASKIQDGEAKAPDNFPVKRGTALVLDDRRCLVWVHGTAISVNPSRPNYYQGKSRIPAPLLITRYNGSSHLSVVVREILGLSKMNWNTFDLYTKLPSTIQSSAQIARIGALLQRFGPLPYDYRLFI